MNYGLEERIERKKMSLEPGVEERRSIIDNDSGDEGNDELTRVNSIGLYHIVHRLYHSSRLPGTHGRPQDFFQGWAN